MMEISVSPLMASDQKKFIKQIESSEADYLHIDVMDGEFVAAKNFNLNEVSKIKEQTTKPLDIHLMVQDIIPAILLYRTLAPKYLTFHLEAVSLPKEIISLIKSFDIKVGISIKPTTDLSLVLPYLKEIDLLLLMSVEPGAGGQKYLEETTLRLSYLSEYITDKKLNTKISLDGGLNDKIITKLPVKPDIVVLGSYLSSTRHPEKHIKKIKKIS